MAVIGYARVSTDAQHTALQDDALRKAGCQRVFTEHVTGRKLDRPELEALFRYVRSGDVVVVWRLDRLGRSVKDLIAIADRFSKCGVQFRSLCEAIDTTTPSGSLVFHVLAAMAQFERDLASDRTKAGLAAARARGRRGGRPTVMTPAKLVAAQELYAGGRLTLGQIATQLGVGRSTLVKHLGAASRDI
jgi:DNA invertase Pin-like site-specific DNA recombinase